MGFPKGDLIPTQAPAASFSELPAQSLAADELLDVLRVLRRRDGARGDLPAGRGLPADLQHGPRRPAAHAHGGTWHWHDWGSGDDGRLIDTFWYYIALESTMKSAATLGVPTRRRRGVDAGPRATRSGQHRQAVGAGQGLLRVHRRRSRGRPRQRARGYSGLAKPGQYEQIRDVLIKVKKSSPYMDKYVLEALYLMGYADAAIARMRPATPRWSATPTTRVWRSSPAPSRTPPAPSTTRGPVAR